MLYIKVKLQKCKVYVNIHKLISNTDQWRYVTL